MPKGVGTVQALDRQYVQQHRRSRLIRVRVVVTHDGVKDAVQRGVKQQRIGRTWGERMLQTQRMTDFMYKGQVVVGALDRIGTVRRRANPYIPAPWGIVGEVSPGSGLRIH